MMKDRFGLGWRPELSAGILSHLDQLDVVEVIVDDYFAAPRQKIQALRTLATQVPIVLHGVTLGLASAVPVDRKRLENIARLVDTIQPEFWSEHLSFVRGGGIEIGHLAAPPRTQSTIAGAAPNLATAKAIVGTLPLVENVATLIDPPGSQYDEPTWIAEILSTSGCDLLLDLHNLYANAVNFDFDPLAYLAHLPSERIAAVHLAGGRWIRGQSFTDRRLLDDHLHDVPDAVYELLTAVGERTTRSLTVILERDGHYPPIEQLLAQLTRARCALQIGRARRSQHFKEQAA
jgi:uncharacterized protein (UPF0276 family)